MGKTEKNKILTISVAAYNIAEFIEQNLESFINSEVRDLIEVIVTDDESKDSTTEIVQKYVEKYPNTIKLIRQKNQGPGSTVNSGIKNATGKYFKMVDGDDWVETENLNILVKKLQETDVDMIITNHKIYDNSINEFINRVKFAIDSNKEIHFSKVCEDLFMDMYNVIYKTSILKENKITLDNGFYTDVEFLLLPIPFVQKVIYYDMDIYVYRVARKGQSVSLASCQKYIDMHYLAFSRLTQYYEQIKDELPQSVRKFMATRIIKMADKELKILLTFEPNKTNKENIKKWFKQVNLMSTDIYKGLIKGRKARMLLISNYILYKTMSKILVKKFKN